ncbi:hypothetical protein HK103_006899 [Boothiomyces macroporosus]|uniref:Uncharacterized protein n=1 Tax=Boothiomyces macroporosus TaxID=261099 RepID=A0AAD5Y5Q4_9FUNG|nr:hypothetical protein HK103_006899 [Boothiomyces macroporosus]
MSDSTSPPLTIINAVLWSLFGHFSQSFDWLAVYLWMVNDFQLTNPIVRSLVLMPAFRLLGDAAWQGINTYDAIHNTDSPFMKSAFPAPLWYTGELIGDTYLPLKAVVISGNQRTTNTIIWGAYSFLAAGKIGQVIGKNYCWYMSRYSNSQQLLTYISNTLDIYVLFAGILNDVVCSLILYSKAKEISKIKPRQLLKTIQTNSSFRIIGYTLFKIIIGIYWGLNICDTNYDICPFYFLRDIIITLDYQLYYLDYFLIQHYGKDKKKVSEVKVTEKNTSEQANKAPNTKKVPRVTANRTIHSDS